MVLAEFWTFESMGTQRKSMAVPSFYFELFLKVYAV
jgi:hypothetical protein